MDKILITVGIGSFLHHIVDGVIALAIMKTLYRALNLKLIKEG